MKILLKNTLRSVEGNKGQVIVIVITIMVVTAMIFVAFSMFDIFYNLNMTESNRIAQNADMLLGRNFASDEFFSEARVRSFVDEKDIDSAFYFAKFGTILKTEKESITVLLEATNQEYYFSQRPLKYVGKFDENTDNPAIDYALIGGYSTITIGESFAKQHKIKVGDLVEIYVPTYNRYTKMIVEYIAKNEGIFGSPADKNILTDFNSVGNNGQVNAVYFNFKHKHLYQKYEEIFAEHFPAVKVDEGNSYSQVITLVKNNTTLFAVGLVFLVSTLMLILATSYMIIARNRASEMIIFKSSGATPIQTGFIMLLEVLLYALIGGGVGLLMGRAAMALAAKTLIPLLHTAISYAWWKYIVSFILAVLVSVIATIPSIRNISKKTIRELTSQSEKLAKVVKPIWLVFTTIILIGFSIAYSFLRGTALLIIAPLLIISVVLWVYTALPYVTKLISFVLRKITKSGSGALASISVLRNKAIKTVAMLIAIVTVFSFLVFEVVGLVTTAVIPFRTRYKADFVINASYKDSDLSNDDIRNKIATIESLESVGYFNGVNFIVPGTEEKECTLYGVDSFDTLKKCTKDLEKATKELWDSTPYAAVLSKDMAVRLNLKVGDYMDIYPMAPDFTNHLYTFKIVGIENTVTEYDRIGYCKYKDIESMTSGSTFLVTAKKGVDKETAFIQLRAQAESFQKKEFYALSYNEWAIGGASNLAGVKILLEILQIVVYFVGIMGILNISIVTAIDRKNEIKLYKIAGMSNSEYLRFSFFEGLIISFSGGVVGLVMSYIINLIMPTFSSLIDKYTAIKYFQLSLILIFIISAALFTFVWVIIALANRNRNIINYNERIIQ